VLSDSKIIGLIMMREEEDHTLHCFYMVNMYVQVAPIMDRIQEDEGKSNGST
jgi:hypothetical protein